MRPFSFLFLFIFLCSTSSFSQNDTSYRYFNENWMESDKDTATFIRKTYKTGDLWSRQSFWIKGNIFNREAFYKDKEAKTPYGTHKSYYKDGSIDNSTVYENGFQVTSTWFYENGNKKANVIYGKKGEPVKQTGWDEQGIEIPDYIAEQEASFGAPGEWQAYLAENLNPGIAAREKAPAGIYTVKVQFVIDKTGKVLHVQAISIPKRCARCADDAVKVIKRSPRWTPAIQFGKNVIYQAIQHVSYEVAEAK